MPRPTLIRFLIVLAAMLAAVLLYLERVCLGVAEGYIREDLRIGKERMDVVLGAFFIAYALGQVPSGWLSQRFGPRLMMTVYLIGWSVFGVFIALAQDFWTLLIARFLLGLSQAGAYPTAALLVKRWVPDRARGRASGVVAFGGRFGGAGANWLTGVLIVAFVPITTPATVTPDDVRDQNPIKFYTNPENETLDRMESHFKQGRVPWFRVCRALRGQPTDPATGDYDPQAVADAYNSVIRDPHALDGVTFEGKKLSRDASVIAVKPPQERTPEETQRLTRLTLEAELPGAIRQLHGHGWRPTLLVYGLLGIVVGALFFAVARNWPRDHPWANAAEVQLIERGQEPADDRPPASFAPLVADLARSPNQWLYSAMNFFSNYGWVFLITLMPQFLDNKFHVPIDQRGLMATVPLAFAAVGLLLGGAFTDRLTRRVGRRWGRALPIGAFKFPCAAVLAVCPFLPDAWSVVIALTVMSVCQDFGLPAVWAFAQDTGGKQSGAVLGWGNMWGNLGAGIAPWMLGQLRDHAGGWDAVLWAGSGAFLLCGVCGLMINADVPLFRRPDDDAAPAEPVE